MGATQSIPQDSETDPWWPNQPQQQTQCNQQIVAVQTVEREATDQEEESWLKLQELSRTIQRLADEHISLTGANREVDKKQKGEINDLREQFMLQQQAMKKLEEDAALHEQVVTCLRNKLEETEKERIGAANRYKELNLTIEGLQQEHENNKHENKRLQEQLVFEKREQEQLLLENKRLAALLENKQSELNERTEEAEDQVIQEPEAENASALRRTAVPSPKAAAELEKFREQMKTKREARHQALQAISNEMERLRAELSAERAAKCEALQELERMKETGVQSHMQSQLEESAAQLNKKTEQCQQLEADKEKYQTQVIALKEVIALSKQILAVRENQVAQLKRSLHEIEGTVMGDKNKGPITVELRAEYQSQMANIKALKQLYEERLKVMEIEKEKILKEQKNLTEELESGRKISEEHKARIKELETIIVERNETVSNLQDQLSDSLDQSRNLSNELALINNIFTQMLVGSDTDLDKLIKVLQENHDLMTQITTNEDCDETAASLPRLLLNLISQVNISEKGNLETPSEDSTEEVAEGGDSKDVPTTTNVCKATEENGLNLDAKEIASKLPKVWKVLLELISQQVVPTAAEENKDCCYKSIDTPNGPRLVISVSKTFIRLKDLIVEKKSLQKELVHLKHLNGHLESKLIQQEKRLSLVSTELRKTWNVVGRMRNQYQQLHTHEKVLRYELQQKRKLLNELKEELEYCREKWVEARKKNTQSEIEWRKLRKEFSSRKKEVEDLFNNSGESGYSDDRGDDSGDDDTGQSTSPIQDTQTKDNELENFEDLPANTNEVLSETENIEGTSISSQNSSLPDLVSISTDHNMPLLASNNLFQNETEEQSEQIVHECPTVSLITLLKRRLSIFSRDLDNITSSMDIPENIKAIQSIFSLPPIQVPEYLLNPKVARPSSQYKSQEEVLDARAARLKRLEEQSQQLFNRVTRTSHRSTELSNRLEELHEQYGTASNIPEPPPLPPTTVTRSPEEILQARAARLKRLEEQCQQLFNKVTRTTERSTTLSNQLDELHQHYGPQDVASTSRLDETSSFSSDIPVPPPLPQSLPSFRLPTSLDDSPELLEESPENENT